MLDERNPEFRAARRGFDGILNEFRARAEHLQEEYAERRAEAAKQQERHEKERAELADRAQEAIKKSKAQEKDGQPEAKPENAWAQPTRLPDSAARIGRFEDDDRPLPVAEQPAPPVAPPAPAPSPPPAAQPEPEAVRGRHARPDDGDDFDSGSFLRG